MGGEARRAPMNHTKLHMATSSGVVMDSLLIFFVIFVLNQALTIFSFVHKLYILRVFIFSPEFLFST